MSPDTMRTGRQGAWRPEPRPEWVARLNEEGDVLNMRSVVPLDEDSLLAAARKNTGLEDFGDDGWMEHFRVLLAAIETEADLNFMGRLLTRAEFIGYLEARLQVQDYFSRFPAIEAEIVRSPVMLLGHDRAGTGLLHDMLAGDPQFRTVKRWEALYPTPPPEESTYLSDPRIQRADRFITLFDRITSEWQKMHRYGGNLSVECTEYLYASFLSKAFLLAFQIPSYDLHLAATDPKCAIRWHQRVLKLLQWKFRGKLWLLKNPSWVDAIPEILTIYPDARIVLVHRDPIVASDSFVNVTGPVFWWRSDQPWTPGMPENSTPSEHRSRVYDNLVKWMQDGTLRTGAVTNVLYQQLIAEPAATLRTIYADLSLILDESSVEPMTAVFAGQQRGAPRKFQHHSIVPDALRSERKIFERYQTYFDVPNEL